MLKRKLGRQHRWSVNLAYIMEVMKRRPAKKEYLVGGIALAITLALCVATIYYWDYVSEVQHYGYLGLFIISILAGGTVVVPVPGLLLVFTFGSVLNPAIVGTVAGLGEAIGSIAVYLTGYGGRTALQATDNQVVNKLTDWIRQRGSLTVFLMSAIFNPLFYPFTALAGMLRFGLVKFFFICWAGKAVKNMLVAYLGYLGLGSLLRWIGVGFWAM